MPELNRMVIIMTTSKATLKTFISSASYINPKLIRAVVSQCGGWDEFKEKAADVANYGGNCGTFGGFIYYKDTVNFTTKNRKIIAEYAAEQSKEIGCKDEIEMILSFNGLQHDDLTSSDIARALYGRLTDDDKKTTIYNFLAWYALEEVSRTYCDLLDQE